MSRFKKRRNPTLLSALLTLAFTAVPLSLQAVGNVCGDGVVNTGVEQCDDGNTDNTDACKNDCTFNVCGDSVVQQSGGALSFTWLATSCEGPLDIEFKVNGTVVLRTLGDSGTCSCSPGIHSVDVTDPAILALLRNGTSTLSVELVDDEAPAYKYLSWAVATSTSQDAVLFDASGGASGRDANLCNGYEGSVTDRGPVYSTSSTLVIAEQCDDGNLIDGDGCDSNCNVTACGNGIVTAGEDCDDGDTAAADGCDAACIIEAGWICRVSNQPCQPVCGDGLVRANEQCDDANTDNADACKNDCTLNVCGDGFVNTGLEPCDDGNTNNTDPCKNDCTFNICGDGIVNTGVEPCDDGNTDNTDPCKNDCTFNVCGDGAVRQSGDLSFIWLATSCEGPLDIEFTVNGTVVLRTLGDSGTCSCSPGIHRVDVTDPAILALLSDGTSTLSVELVDDEAPASKELSWAVAIITGTSQDVVMFDASGGASSRDPNLCHGADYSVAASSPLKNSRSRRAV